MAPIAANVTRVVLESVPDDLKEFLLAGRISQCAGNEPLTMGS